MAGVASTQSATMTYDHSRRSSTIPFGAPESIPHAPPLPAPRPLQRARDAATRLFGYQSRPPSPVEEDRFRRGSRARFASLSATENATASHKTGLELNTIAINEQGTHALLGGKEIFKTIKVEDGRCTEELNLRSAIRSNPTQASGKARQVYSIDIADVAWAKGDCGHYVAAATSSGKIILYDLGHAGLPAAQLHEHFRQVHKVTFNPHRGSLLLSGSQDGTVRLWDVRDVRQASTLKSKHKYSGQSDGVRDVKWSPTEGVDFAFGTDSGWIQRWDIRNLKTAKVKIPAHSTTCNTIDWHPDGKHIVSASSDKTVRVWDFSVSRRQKASWEIKTPYPVLNARWRPSCESSISYDRGARQCTQLVTAYDHSHPLLHIWDFRRPALPFREMAPYLTAPTDLLWHSQDLLWTVGRDGVFLQADIQHAPKVIDKRNLQAFAVSPLGDINFVTQKRRRQRHPKQSDTALQNASVDDISASFISRSWADDSFDETFLALQPRWRNEPLSRSKTRAQSLSMASSSDQIHHSAAVICLDEILLGSKSGRPIQIGCRGLFPGPRDTDVTAYLARNYKTDVTPVLVAEDVLGTYLRLLHHNSHCTEDVGLYRLSQSWRMMKVMLTAHLEDRSDDKRKRRLNGRPQIQTPVRKGILSQVARRITGEYSKSPVPSPSSLKPVSSIARQLALSDSASSQQTPLARPVTSSKAFAKPLRNGLPDPDKDEQLALPPLLTPAVLHAGTVANKSPHDRRLTIGNLDGLQKLNQGVNGLDRADMVRKWSVQHKEPLSLDPVDSKGMKIPPKLEKHDSDESFAFLAGSVDSRAPSFPASFTSSGSGPLQMVAERPSRTSLNGVVGGGTEDFDFGRGEPVSLNSAVPISRLEHLSARPVTPSYLTTVVEPVLDDIARMTINDENATSQDLDLGSYPDENGIYSMMELVTAKLQPQRKVEPSSALLSPHFAGKENKSNRSVFDHHHHPESVRNGEERRDPAPSVPEKEEASPYLPGYDDSDLEEGKPLNMIDMLREQVRYYAGRGDAQTASHLILLIGPLLPRTRVLPQAEIVAVVSWYLEYFTAAGYTQEDIETILDKHIESLVTSGIQPLQMGSVLSTYHEQLMRMRLFNEAAVLRKVSYPAYPAVYDQNMKDNYVHLRCGDCGKPMSTGTETLRCESCGTKQASCPVCWCHESPFDVDTNTFDKETPTSDEHTITSSKKTSLMTTCLSCNHSGHIACIRMWFDDGERDGGCPVEGCLCDCVAGIWRAEKARLAERKRRYRSHSRVKSDDWPAQESKAVERTRDVLSVGIGKTPQTGFSA